MATITSATGHAAGLRRCGCDTARALPFNGSERLDADMGHVLNLGHLGSHPDGDGNGHGSVELHGDSDSGAVPIGGDMGLLPAGVRDNDRVH